MKIYPIRWLQLMWLNKAIPASHQVGILKLPTNNLLNTPDMIARIWHGRTSQEQADTYETLLKNEIIPGIQEMKIPGFKNIQVLKRQIENETEFTTIMWFDDLESVKQFAGEDYETAYVPKEARKVLSRFDKRVIHSELRWSISQNR